jgi:hypothetical protein
MRAAIYCRRALRKRALLRRNMPTAIISKSEIPISMVAAAAIVKLILSLMPRTSDAAACAARSGHQQSDNDFIERRRERENGAGRERRAE